MSSQEKEPKVISRRAFVRGAAGSVAAVAGAGALSAGTVAAQATCPVAQIPEKWDYEADVIVVGSGGAGMACAVAASEKKASVIVLEANDKIGGKTILAGGNLGIGGGTRMQIDKGYEEDADIIYQDRTDWTLRTDKTMEVIDVDGGVHEIGQWRRISGAEDAEGLARVFADRSLDTWNWLDEMGCPFIQANVSGKSAVYRGSRYYTTTAPMDVDPDGQYQKGGAGLIRPMEARALENGVEILYEHKMTRIIRECERSGRVLGVEVDAGGETLYFRARKAVMLGTGSWKGNKNIKVLFNPWLSKYPHISGEPYVWNDGSGIQAALDIGASLTTDRGSDWHGWHRHPGTLWHSINLPYGMPGTAEPLDTSCIYVNNSGQRFMNEMIGEDNPAWIGGNPPYYFAQICAQQEGDADGPIVWIVMDDDLVTGQPLDIEVGRTVDEAMYATADTIEELAEMIKVPADALVETVEHYNEMVDAGVDEDFGKKELAAKIAKPPFHALKWGIQKHNTLGGITINAKAQVMDWHSQVIPGLYAAGEVAGGMDLIGLSRPILFGRVAGEWAAEEPTMD